MSERREALRTDVGARVRRGEVVYGAMVYEFFTPGLPAVLRGAGLDFAIFDMEATPLDLERLRVLCHLSHAVGLAPMVRVPHSDGPLIGRCLNAGAVGVMAPHVESVEAATAFVAATRFPPAGDRGAGYGSFPDAYLTSAPSVDEHPVVLTIAQLESLHAVEQAAAIAAVDGLDVVNVGAADLAASLTDGQDRPTEVAAAVRHTHAACREQGAAYGGPPVEHRASAGPAHRLVLLEHDTAALQARLRGDLQRTRAVIEEGTVGASTAPGGGVKSRG